MTLLKKILVSSILLLISAKSSAALLDDLNHLKAAYPDAIQQVSEKFITWNDGTQMPVQEGNPNKSKSERLDSPALVDQISAEHYNQGNINLEAAFQTKNDAGRIRYEPFFKKMYGSSQQEVESHLTAIYWMPKRFGKQYILLVTTVNQVNEKLIAVSDELDALVQAHPEYEKYLIDPAGTYSWRNIAGTNRISNHSFGMTFDLHAEEMGGFTNYWRWELVKTGIADSDITEDTQLPYVHNQIPWEIILIFEKHGFIWGGKWYHYDTMHFEYRPELLV